jgi:hypothetical protein
MYLVFYLMKRMGVINLFSGHNQFEGAPPHHPLSFLKYKIRYQNFNIKN